MRKTELVSAVAKDLGVSFRQATKAVNAYVRPHRRWSQDRHLSLCDWFWYVQDLHQATLFRSCEHQNPTVWRW